VIATNTGKVLEQWRNRSSRVQKMSFSQLWKNLWCSFVHQQVSFEASGCHKDKLPKLVLQEPRNIFW